MVIRKGKKMDEVKGLLQSRTFWGAAVAVLGGIGGMLGFTFGPDEQQAFVELATTIVTAVGGVYAMYGRVKATKKIG